MPETSTFVDAYTLPRNNVESSRLEQQHHLIAKTLGFVLHPRIRRVLPEEARIADVATGTGIWMRELAADAPSTWSFHGFDLSDAQFPPPTQHGRCNYQTLNILKPIPLHLVQSFDVVHIRYLICALSGRQWHTVAKNVFQMLKPGGYLQWQESNFFYTKSVQSKPENSLVALKDLMNHSIGLLMQQDATIPGAVEPGLKKTVETSNFVDVMEDVIASDRVPELRTDSTIVSLKALCSAASALLKRGSMPGKDQAWLDEMYEKAVREVHDGSYFWWTMHVVTAMKPASMPRI